METERPIVHGPPGELLESLDALVHVGAQDVMASVLAHDAAAKLTASLTETLTASETQVAALTKQADDTAAGATA
jgi:hypothetical protein